ncbi:hypothetical protein [Crocosphaera sp. XPORK-15E]|uniref:hypothetical protein n=1 Tax=Crocosphaera sp. XPORK-15E TaxID=3110247 RepID=UPI002B1FF9DE|nr:hypothetical protein [Crocosphaera sp. XPORK-15E]MEA5536555.1 hypothetical protein [Crocosphaera sp. XPORK-15E]
MKRLPNNIKNSILCLYSNQTFSVTDYYLSKATYEQALTKAGLTNVRFLFPTVSAEGQEKLGQEFWQDLLDYPPLIMIEGVRKS